MAERQDYIALDWVAGEIGETLEQAALALEAYASNREDITKLRFCVTHVHQVHGTLTMVEFFGAALLAEEMEGLAHALMQGAIPDSHIDDALTALKNAISQLPLYLNKVKESRHGLPAALLPVLNDLRSVRGENLLSETVLFSPDLSIVGTASDTSKQRVTDELKEIAHKLRQMFQIALLGLIKGKEVRKNLNYLAKVCARLVKVSEGYPILPLWRVCLAVLEGLLNGSIETNISVKILLRQLDRYIKSIVATGEAALQSPPPEDLLKNLLYYVARSKANSKFIREIKSDFHLDTSLLGEGELGDEMLETPDSEAMQGVVNAIKEELAAIKIDLADASNDSPDFAGVLHQLKRVTDTMAILGMGNALKPLHVAHAQLEKLLVGQETIAANDLDKLFEQVGLAEAEFSPSIITEAEVNEEELFNDSEEAQGHLDSAFHSVLRESRRGLEQIKEAIIEFVATQWSHDCLSDVPQQLAVIRGSLAMVPLEKAAALVNSCERYVSEALLEKELIPDWQKLDTLADALTSVDYYLERLSDDSEIADETILAVAADSVADLGYPVDSTESDQSPVQENNLDDGLVDELSSDDISAENIEPQVQPARLDEKPIIADVLPFKAAVTDEFAASELAGSPPVEPGFVDNEIANVSSSIPMLTEPSEGNKTELESVSTVTEESNEAAEDFDPEIVEIFVEEADEVLEIIDQNLPLWQSNVANEEAATTVRRAFHTLKGSGRMVGAMEIGELAWSIEALLNRVQDGSIRMDQQRFDLVSTTRAMVPGLVDAFEKRQAVEITAVEQLIEKANLFASEQNPHVADPEVIVDSPEAGLESVAEITDLNEKTDAVNITANDESDQHQHEVPEDIDWELLEIFAAEAASHDQVLDDFILHCRGLDGVSELTDELQRALHTLKGSANMAVVTPVAAVVTPLEHLVKELRATQLKTDQSMVDILERGSAFIKAGLQQLTSTPLKELPGTAEYKHEITDYLQQKISIAANELVTEEGVAPDTFNEFLSDSLDRIMDVSQLLAKLQYEQLDDAELLQLEELVESFADQAETLNLTAPLALGQAMLVLFRRLQEVPVTPLPADFFLLTARANDTVVDMLDQIAGHQTPSFDQKLLDELQSYEFNFDAEAADIEVITDDNTLTDDIDNEVDAPEPLINLDSIELDHSAKLDIFSDSGDQDLIAALTEDKELLDKTGYVELDLDALIGGAGQRNDEQKEAALASGEFDQDNLDSGQQTPTVTDPEFVLPDSADGISEQQITDVMSELVDSAAQAHNVSHQDQKLNNPEPQSLDPIEADSSITSKSDYPPSTTKDAAQPVSFHPVGQAVDDDDDMEEEIIAIFLEEADDLQDELDEAIHGLLDDYSNRECLNNLLRVLHTLKGGARLAGLMPLGNLSHNFETMLIDPEGQPVHINENVVSEAQQYQDKIIAMLAAIKLGEVVDDVAVAEQSVESGEPIDENDVDPFTEAAEQQGPVEDSSSVSIVSSVDDDITINLSEDFGNELDLIDSDSVSVENLDEEQPLSSENNLDQLKEPEPIDASAQVVQRLREVSSQEIPMQLVDPAAKKGPQEVVKVSAQLLEELVNLAGETSISRGRAEEQISELVFSLDEMQTTVDRLQDQVRRLDMETEQQILYRQEQVESEGLEGFDPLEMDRYSQLQQLSRSLLESSSDLIDIKSTLADKSRDMETLLVQQSRINTELQEGLMRSRMVPFSRMVPRLRRIIRQVSAELHKKVDFHLDNIEGELDRTVMERMVAPLEHMLRNAVDHGIESSDEREAAGKPKRGRVSLGLNREGGEIVLTLVDDGAGIDIEAVKRKAIERGLMEAEAELSDRELLQFIVQSGFTTASSVTQISGRGVGMDVVHSEIKQLGGSMEIDSVQGQGSRFIVRLPFTVSVNRALMVSIAGDSYAIPLNSIEGIVRVSPFELEAYYQPDAPMFEYAGQPYQMRYMGALLNRAGKPSLEGLSMPLPVILVRGADHSVAIQVDALMGSREIVVKPLGPQFSMVQGLTGATVLGDGSVVVILDLLAMIRADASHLHRDLTQLHVDSREEERSTLVMVVDDSVTVRKVTSRFLEREGMEVILAKDGLDAVTQLHELDRIPDVMLLDIEMPRMDGFEVASRVRHNSRLKDLPIIMITSRTGEKHRERAFSLGVNEYIGKPYQESTLLEAITTLSPIKVEH